MKLFKTVDSLWEITETTRLFGLTLTDGGKITAPAGKLVTLVYNGENIPLLPGQYEGDVVLEVTDAVRYQNTDFRAAVTMEDGKYAPEKSIRAAAIGGEIGDGKISGVSVTSMEEAVNGIFVSVPEGEETVIENVKLDMLGNGGNDFIGYGAAIAASGKGKLTVNKSDIRTHGAARGSIYAGDHIHLEVNDTKIASKGGVLNADYEDTIKTTLPGVMRRVPWMLGLRGNCRATNLLDYAEAEYNRCNLSAEGWGVLSTDGVKRCRMNVNDCDVTVTGPSGYAALSIGDCVVNFNGSRVKTPDYAMIMMMGKGSGGFLDGSTVDSGRFITMSSMNTGLVEARNSTLRSEETAFVVKGSSTEFRLDNCSLSAGNGIILQVMNSDDPGNPTGFYTDPEGQDEKDESRDLYTAEAGTDVVASFSGMSLVGDFYNGSSNLTGDTGGANLLAGAPGAFPEPPAGAPDMGGGFPPMGNFPAPPAGAPDMGGGFPPMGGDFPPMGDLPEGGFDMPSFGGPAVKNLQITLKDATLTGCVSASVAKHRVPKVDKSCCEELGEVVNTPCPAINNGVIVILEGKSTWNVTAPGYITALTIGDDATLRAGRLLVDGRETPIAPGSYRGAITILP